MKQNTKTNTDVCCGLTLQCPHRLIIEASGAILWWNFRNKNDRSRLLGANPWRVIPTPGHGLCPPGLYHVISCPHLLLWWKTESPLPEATLPFPPFQRSWNISETVSQEKPFTHWRICQIFWPCRKPEHLTEHWTSTSELLALNLRKLWELFWLNRRRVNDSPQIQSVTGTYACHAMNFYPLHDVTCVEREPWWAPNFQYGSWQKGNGNSSWNGCLKSSNLQKCRFLY